MNTNQVMHFGLLLTKMLWKNPNDYFVMEPKQSNAEIQRTDPQVPPFIQKYQEKTEIPWGKRKYKKSEKKLSLTQGKAPNFLGLAKC